MFTKKKIIVSLTKDKIQAGEVVMKAPLRINRAVEGTWSPETLNALFQQLRDRYNTKIISIVFGEDVSFVTCVAVIKGEDDKRDLIKKQAQSILPVDLDKTKWDYKDVFERKGHVVAQVAALLAEPVELVLQAVEHAGITIEAMEPASYALARLTEDGHDPHIILYQGNTIIAVVAHRGLVLASTTLQDMQDVKAIKTLVDSVKEHYGIEPKQVIYSHEGLEALAKKCCQSKEIKHSKLHPMLGIAIKTDVKGKDQEIMNIAGDQQDGRTIAHPPAALVSDQETVTNKDDAPSFVRYIYVVIGIVLIVALGLLVVGYISRRTSQPDAENIANILEDQDQIIEPTITPQPPELSEFSIRVLNGSGVAGEAGRVKDLLSAEGFEEFDTGNADAYDFTDTTVRLKEDVPETVYDSIKQALGDDYTIIKSDSMLTSNFAYDIVVTVGARNEEPSE